MAEQIEQTFENLATRLSKIGQTNIEKGILWRINYFMENKL